MLSSPKTDSPDSTPSPSEATPIISGAVRGILDRQLSHSKISAFFDGLRAPIDGLSLFLQFPKLWWYGIAPILINLVITIGVLLAGLFFGYLGFKTHPNVGTFGFTVFIFAVGYQEGPSFFAVFLSDGLKYLTLFFLIDVIAVSLAMFLSYIFHFEFLRKIA